MNSGFGRPCASQTAFGRPCASQTAFAKMSTLSGFFEGQVSELINSISVMALFPPLIKKSDFFEKSDF